MEEASGNRGSRQRLKPWLEAQINAGKYPGLFWRDKGNRIFQIKWKHSGRADWHEEDGQIFKAWAVHTGRFREGVDEPDYPTWKTRLRCAINKQKPDIVELRDESCNDEPNPYRVYQFRDRRDSDVSSPGQSSSPGSVCDADVFSVNSPPPRPSVIQRNNGNIPTTVSESLGQKPPPQKQEESTDDQMSSLGNDLKQVKISDLVVPDKDLSLTHISFDSNINSFTESMETDSLKGAAVPVKPERQDPLCFGTGIDDNEMLVTLRFREETIYQHRVTNPYGCRVYYGDLPHSDVWHPQMFGSMEADQIQVPFRPQSFPSQAQVDYTQQILQGFELGINLFMGKRSIYIQRNCKTRIITAPVNEADQKTRKVERQTLTKLFDFTEGFLPAFLQYQQGEGPRPSPQVVIAIGQDFLCDTEPYPNLFLSVTVCHAQASYLLSQHTINTTVPEMSHSDQFDQHLTAMKNGQMISHNGGSTMIGAPATQIAFDDSHGMM